MSSGIVGGDSIGRFMARIGREADVGLDWDGVDQIVEQKKYSLAGLDNTSYPLPYYSGFCL